VLSFKREVIGMQFENLSKGLKSLRELAGLSQYEFARLSGISRGRISLVECGHSELNEDEHCRAGRVLRAAIADRYKNFKSIVERGPETSSRAADGER
jgi:transcriptional regulator with XRE-family HTH domain